MTGRDLQIVLRTHDKDDGIMLWDSASLQFEVEGKVCKVSLEELISAHLELLEEANMSKCRSCEAEIEWVKTKAGKNMPCDPEILCHDEMDEGDILVTIDGHVQKVDKSKRFPSLKGYVSHFATCKDANDWRKK